MGVLALLARTPAEGPQNTDALHAREAKSLGEQSSTRRASTQRSAGLQALDLGIDAASARAVHPLCTPGSARREQATATAVARIRGFRRSGCLTDYQLTATAVATSCSTVGGVTQYISSRAFPIAAITGLVPGEKGRVTATITLAREGGCGGICVGTLHMDYSDVTLTNLTSGDVYRLDPIGGDSP